MAFVVQNFRACFDKFYRYFLKAGQVVLGGNFFYRLFDS